MKEEILEQIRRIVWVVSGNKSLEVNMETELVDGLNFNSIMFFMLLTAIEDRFGIVVSERQIRQVDTIGDIVDLLAQAKK